MGVDKDDGTVTSESGFPVGERLRLVRNRLGLSQRALARRAAITNGALSNIEQGKVSPSLSSLERILNAIPMSIQRFFDEETALRPIVYPAEQALKLNKQQVEHHIVPIADFVDSELVLAQQTYKPGARIESNWMVRKGRIAGLVVSGRIQLIVDDIEYLLSEGDAFDFAIQKPHGFTNVGDVNCVIVSVSVAES